MMKSREFRLILIVLTVALVFRIGHLFMLHNDPIADVLLLDSASYDQLARLILQNEMPKKVYFQAPFYPYFLACFYMLSPDNLDLVRIIQMFLDAISAVLVYRVTHRLFNASAALIAGLGMAVYPVSIFHSGLILKTTLNIFFASLMLWLILDWRCKSQAIQLVLLGTITGIAAATQGSVLLQIPLLFVWVAVESGWNKPYRWIVPMLWLSLGLMLGIGPFTYRNFHVSNRFVLLTSQGGANFYLGNSPYSDGTSKRPPRVRMTPEYEEDDFHREAERSLGKKLTPEESSRYWVNEAFRWIRENPRDALRLQIRKLGLFWNRVEIPDNYDFDFHRRYSLFIRFPRYPFWIVGSLGLAGMLVLLPTWRKTWFLYTWIISYCAIWVLFHIYSRYRLPVVVFLLPFAGALCNWLYDHFKRRNIIVLLKSAIVMGGIVLIQSLPLTSYSHAQPLFNRGVGLTRLGNLTEARQAYLDALKVSPDYDPALVNLGKLAWSSGRQTDAVTWWEKALKINPDAVEAHSNLGAYKAARGDMASARDHFKRAVDVQPYYFLGWLHLAQAEQALGNFDEALNDFEQALELSSDHPQALYGRAVCHDALHHPETLKAWEDYAHAAKSFAEELPFVLQAEQRINELNSINQGI